MACPGVRAVSCSWIPGLNVLRIMRCPGDTRSELRTHVLELIEAGRPVAKQDIPR